MILNLINTLLQLDIGNSIAGGAAVGSAIPGIGTAVGGLVGGALGIASNLFNNSNQVNQNQRLLDQQKAYNEQLSSYNEGVQLDLWQKTNYEAQREQMEKAGINPAMMWAKGMNAGGTTAANTVATTQATTQQNKPLDITNAADAINRSKKTEAEIPNIQQDTQLKAAEALNTTAKTKMQELQNEITGTELPNLEEIINQTANGLRADAHKKFSEGALTQQQVDIMEKTWNEQLSSIGIENALKKAQTSATNANEQATIASVSQTWANIKIAQQNANTNKNNAMTNSLNQKVNEGMLQLQQQIKNLDEKSRTVIESMLKLAGIAAVAL